MTPKQLHLLCDFILILPLIGILLSVLFFSNKLEKELYIIKELFSAWRRKPIQILQDSYEKTCEEIGMNDIILYDWPGTDFGCFCPHNKALSKGVCNDKEIKMLGCKDIDEIYPYTAKKWKTSYLCSSSINSKSYFELNRIRNSEQCSYKHKKCGIIDTLGNYLCIPENENCPLNSISFRNNIEDQNVRIDSTNNKENGKIYSSFKVAEQQLCVNHIEREFFEHDFLLIKKLDNELGGCYTSVYDQDNNKFYFDKTYDKLDTYPKKKFYEHNKIFPFLKEKVPKYPFDINSNVSLYASVFTGWKRECDKKEFIQYRNSNNITDSEIIDIMKATENYNPYLYICTLALSATFIFGVVILKYSRILNGNHKIEITPPTLVMIVITYILLIVINIILYYISDINLDVVKNAKVSNNFFEMISNYDCSDSFTNSRLKYAMKEFFLYANRYFNIKIFSFISMFVSIIIIMVSIFAKSSTETLRKNKKYG